MKQRARSRKRKSRKDAALLAAAMAIMATALAIAGPEPEEARASADPETAGKILVEGQIWMSESEYEAMRAERAAVIEAERQAEAILIQEAPPVTLPPIEDWEPAFAEPVTAPAYLIAECTLPAETQRAIREICDRKGVPYSLIMSMAATESEFDPHARGDNGRSKGLLQIQPKFYPEEAARIGLTDIDDPVQNADLGTEIMAGLFEKHGDVHKALMEYNQGPDSARRSWKKGVTSTTYSRTIVERAAEYEKELEQ